MYDPSDPRAESPPGLLQRFAQRLPGPTLERLGRDLLRSTRGPDAFRYSDSSAKELEAVLRDYRLPGDFTVGHFPDYRNKRTGEITGAIHIVDPGGGKVMVLDARLRDVRINSFYTSGLCARDTSLIYQAIYTWIRNIGKRVVPDYTYSADGIFRRTSHMLCSALRHRSAQHMMPHDAIRQVFLGDQSPKDPRYFVTLGGLAWMEARMTLERLNESNQNPYETTAIRHETLAPSLLADQSGAGPAAADPDRPAARPSRGQLRIGPATAQRALRVAQWLGTQRMAEPFRDHAAVGSLPAERPEHRALPDGRIFY